MRSVPVGRRVSAVVALLAPLAVLASSEAEWPKLDKSRRLEGYKWKGYTLDAKRFPTFFYEWNGMKVADQFDVEGNAVTGQGKLLRALTLTGEIPANALFRVAGSAGVQVAGGAFLIEGGRFSQVGIALSAVGLTTVHLTRAEDLLRGQPPSEELFAQAREIAAEDCSPSADGRGPIDYKRHLAGVLTQRALRRATERALS